MKNLLNFLFLCSILFSFAYTGKSNLKNKTKRLICKEGYSEVSGTCYKDCPHDMVSIVGENYAICKISSYDRPGYLLGHEQQCNENHSQGCEQTWGMWKPKCMQNYVADGCCQW